MRRAWKKIRHYYSVLGVLGVAAFLFAKLFGKRFLFRKRLPGIKHPVFLRVASSDASVLKQVLFERHYDLPRSLDPKVIVDAGANIGLSAVFFANKYPGATVYALEPEESNFRLLQRNASGYPQIIPLNLALWRDNTRMSVIDFGGHDSFQTVEGDNDDCPGNHNVRATTVDGLMTEVGVRSIDILKIDIEGAEKEVFESSGRWIDKVSVIMVELHDHIKEGAAEAFYQATQGFDETSTQGEIVMRLRNSNATEKG